LNNKRRQILHGENTVKQPTTAKPLTKGFTLIELLVTLVIMGIISAIAIPAYGNYAKKARRSDAKAALTTISNALERYHSVNNTYAGATLGAGGIYASQTPVDGAIKYYNLAIVNPTVNAYRITAVPRGDQTGDGLLSIDSTGVKIWNSNDAGTGDNKDW
jgi:type IV pilus assembly protein PilE